MTKYKRIRPRE